MCVDSANDNCYHFHSFISLLNKFLDTLSMQNNAAAKTAQSDAKNIEVMTSRAITSEALFAGQRELLIEHAGAAYLLRLTNLGKLILTK